MTQHTPNPTSPAPGVRVLGRRALWHHAAVLPFGVEVTVGPAVGSQADAGPVAHVLAHYPGTRHAGSGFTTDDPAALEQAGRTLLAAAVALREARA